MSATLAPADLNIPHRPPAGEGALAQSARLGFLALFAAMAILALGWLTQNVRQVPPDSRAVVLRLGAVARQQDSGLLLAWPRPIEEVRLLPAADRLIAFDLPRFTLPVPAAGVPAVPRLNAETRRNGGFLLTGDGSVAHLQARLFYRITDPAAYVTARDHIPPALERLFAAAATAVAASRDLDRVLVARPDRDDTDGSLRDARDRLRADLLRALDERLAPLGLGIAIGRVDLVAGLPAEARDAFDEVLRVTQTVEADIATARTAAERRDQEAQQARDKLLADAQAAAAERVATARARTATITALTEQPDQGGDALLQRLWRERVEALLHRARRVETVDPAGGVHLLLPAAGLTP